MKKLMILGAAASQVPLISAAKRLGYETIVTSIPGDYPGFTYADVCCYADISKPEEVLAKAKELNIDGITTCGMDTGIRAIGRVCDELGLWGISYKTACTLSDKYLSKLAFEKAGVPCAKAFQIRTEEELSEALEKLPLPVVVKAVDLMGSRGIPVQYQRRILCCVFKRYEKYLQGLLPGGGIFRGSNLWCRRTFCRW